MFWRLFSMRRGPRLGPQRGLIVPGCPLRGRSRLWLLQDPRALCPPDQRAMVLVRQGVPSYPRGAPHRPPRLHCFPPTTAVTPLHLRWGRGSDTPQPAPFPPVIIQVPLGIRVRSTTPTLFSSLSGGPGPGRSRSGLRVSASPRRPEPGRHFV
ncbi:hypothetical protein NDU88_004655 [Pleurodeles waltl]|uniref:Uncharacterized protein n=1 Tax=Pleurodeles waltl TaxID=8319 RepID=A0AAV7M6Y2_PLEWA|nr:hypothetical protein NDU88_004655 [Pleurodeles waltl]